MAKAYSGMRRKSQLTEQELRHPQAMTHETNPNIPPGLQALPASPGSVISTDYTPEDAIRQIQKIKPDFKRGDVIPNDLADVIDRHIKSHQEDIRRQVAEEKRTVLPPGALPNQAPLAMPQEVTIESLPPAKQAEIRGYIEEVTRKVKQRDEIDKATVGLPPEIANAYREAARDPGPIKAAEAPAAATKPEPTAVAAPAKELSTAAHHCPQCGWDVHNADTAAVSEEDKLRYVTAVVSGKRFYKDYSLFGGRLRVTFRTLLTREEREIRDQIYRDMLGLLPVVTELHLMQMSVQTQDYRMALSIESFSNDSGTEDCPEFGDLDFDTPKDEVKTMHANVVEDLLKTDIVTDAVRRAYGKFAALQAWMLANASNPEFF